MDDLSCCLSHPWLHGAGTQAHLILVDRFSGGAVAALSAQVGVGVGAAASGFLLDPAIEAFEVHLASVRHPASGSVLRAQSCSGLRLCLTCECVIRWQRRAKESGWRVEHLQVPKQVRDAVEASLSWPGLLLWRASGTWDGLRLYRMSLPSASMPTADD